MIPTSKQRNSSSYVKILYIVSIATLACTLSLPNTDVTEQPGASQDEPQEMDQSQGQPQDVESSHPLLFFPGIIEIQNVMPLSGVGERPQLEWPSVDGAGLYGITLFEPAGTPYWAWRGKRNWVYVGGIDNPLPEKNEGPIIVPGMTWQVVAYDEEEVPIAAGGPWPIAP